MSEVNKRKRKENSEDYVALLKLKNELQVWNIFESRLIGKTKVGDKTRWLL